MSLKISLVALAGMMALPFVALPAAAQQSCPAGQMSLDGQKCVTLQAWPNRTPLPDGTVIAIRLRVINRNYQGNTEPWPMWLGVSPKDNVTINAVDANLTSRNLFTIRTFSPQGQQYYDLPWFNMRASNGKFVGRVRSSTGGLAANFDEANAETFVRGWNPQDAAKFAGLNYAWSKAPDRLKTAINSGNYYAICLSPFNVGIKFDSVDQWLSGPAPSYSCYASGNVDYYVVKG
ncbi:MAG TPA: hypothetical protein VGO34_11940 [Alphaproteobacteria bacterium]